MWTITSGFPALAAHVLVDRDTDCHATRRELESMLHERFGLDHTTLQVDHEGGELLQIETGPRARGEPMIARRDGYEVDDDPRAARRRRDLGLSARRPTGRENVPREVVERAIAGSLCVGLYAPDGAQVGFARAVTDRATYAWIADVFVLERAPRPRARRLAGRDRCSAHPDAPGAARRSMLATRDAHGLYERFGFVREGEWTDGAANRRRPSSTGARPRS